MDLLATRREAPENGSYFVRSLLLLCLQHTYFIFVRRALTNDQNERARAGFALGYSGPHGEQLPGA